MANRILFVPWQSTESIQHYASRRGIPTTLDKFGNLVFDLQKTRGHAPWASLLQPLVDFDVLNPARYPNESKNDYDTRVARMHQQVSSGTFPGGEYASKNRHWKQSEAARQKGHDWYEVWYTGRISPILMSLRAEDQVYIRGHGLPGDSAIHSGAWRLDAEEVARRLIASGLQPGFSGKIKCYNCHSADSGIGTAFAQALADSLFTAGYVSCRYYGYLGALDSYPGANDATTGSAQQTNSSQAQGKFPKSSKTTLYGGNLYRASELRQQITPQKKTPAKA